MLSLLKLHVYTLTTIGLLSDVREANTSGLVSKTQHKRDRAAPNLGMMLDYKRGVFVSDPSRSLTVSFETNI